MPVTVIEVPPPPPPPVFLRRRLWFTSVTTGDRIDLDDQTYLLLHGAEVGPADPELVVARYPQHDGGAVRAVRLGLDEVFVPVAVQATSTAGLRDALQDLERLLDAKRGQVTLTVSQPDGEVRAISGYAKTERGEYDIDYQLLNVTITCPDPYWQGAARELRFVASPTAKDFLASGAFFPVRFTPSEILGAAEATNEGDADSYPVWTFDGPFDGVEVISHTLGVSFEVTGSVTTGHQLIVDTRPWVQTVRDELGANLFANLTIASSLFPLAPGVNDLEFVMAMTGSETAATLQWTPRYRSS